MSTSWYDWIPGVSEVSGAKKGNWGQVFLGPGMAGKGMFFDDPANEQKAGYDAAMAKGDAGTQQLVDFYMGQQAKAQANYKPLQDMFKTAYGTNGIAAPALPGGAPPPKGGR